MTPYTEPNSEIHQLLQVDEPSAGSKNVLVIGPQRILQINDGRPMDLHTFAETFPLRARSNGTWVPVSDNVTVEDYEIYGQGLEALIAEDVIAFGREDGYNNRLRLVIGYVHVAEGAVGSINAGLPRAVRVGDVVTITDENDEERRRRVTALLPAVTAASFSATEDGQNWVNGASPGTYSGAVARTYELRITAVTGSFYEVLVLDSAGLTPVTPVSLEAGEVYTPIPGQAISIKIPVDQEVGDSCFITATPEAASPGLYDGILLDGPLPGGSSLIVNILQPFSGKLTSANAGDGGEVATLTDGEITFGNVGLPAATTGLDGDFANFVPGIGKVFASWRAIVKPSNNEVPVVVSSGERAVAVFGEGSYGNPLCAGIIAALQGIADSPAPVAASVYGLRTAGDSAEDYVAALQSIRGQAQFYAIVPTSQEQSTQAALRQHVLDYSRANRKLWRKLYASFDNPGDTEVVGVLDRGTRIAVRLNGGSVIVEAADEELVSFEDVAEVGDIVTVGGLGFELTVTDVVSNGELSVVRRSDGSSVAGVDVIGGLGLIKPASWSNTRRVGSERAIALRDRRVVLVWANRALDASGEVIPNSTLAAYEAGARVGSLSQVGRTRGRVSIVSNIPVRLDAEDLNELAQHGVYIITQDAVGGPVYVRHQLTTEPTKGLLYSEDNITAIVDDYTRGQKSIIDEFIGPRNVTAPALSDLRDELRGFAIEQTQTPREFSKYGPPIVTFFDADGKEGDVTVRQDVALADHVTAHGSIRVPVSINGIRSFVDVEVSTLA